MNNELGASHFQLRVAILDVLNDSSLARFRRLLPDHYALSCARARGDDHLKDLIADADYAVSGQVAVSGDVLRAATRLKLLHKWGVGVDNLDLDAARALGIRVARTTGGNAVPVAEYTLGLMLAATRHLAFGHAELKRGIWRGFPLPRESLMISGKTVGIVGFGAIGQRVAQLLSGFGCRILYTKRTPLAPEAGRALNAESASLERLLAESDIVSLHCPLTEETAGMIDREALRKMKPSAILVNVARGGIVDEAALYDALKNGELRAAASDVFEIEPLPADSPLLSLDNMVVSPHLAALASDNFDPVVNRIIANFERTERGEPVPEFESVVG
jgi:D-3-phosphoglycerate dehydrogenase